MNGSTHLVSRIIRSICAVSALVTAALIMTGMPSIGLETFPLVAFAVAPYTLLAALAGTARDDKSGLRLVLAITAAVSAGGLFLFAFDGYRYHAVAEHRMVQRMTVLAVPLLQLLTIVFGGSMLLIRKALRRKREDSSQ